MHHISIKTGLIFNKLIPSLRQICPLDQATLLVMLITLSSFCKDYLTHFVALMCSHRRSCPYRTVGQLPQLLRGTKPPPLSSLRSETGAVPRLGGGCTQAACFFSISSAAGSTSTASCCFPLRVLVGFCKSSALTASRACVCGILQVRSTVNCSRHHHAR